MSAIRVRLDEAFEQIISSTDVKFEKLFVSAVTAYSKVFIASETGKRVTQTSLEQATTSMLRWVNVGSPTTEQLGALGFAKGADMSDFDKSATSKRQCVLELQSALKLLAPLPSQGNPVSLQVYGCNALATQLPFEALYATRLGKALCFEDSSLWMFEVMLLLAVSISTVPVCCPLSA